MKCIHRRFKKKNKNTHTNNWVNEEVERYIKKYNLFPWMMLQSGCEEKNN